MIDLEKAMYHAAREGRIDANETLAFAREFEHIMSDVQMAEGIDLVARRIFPVIGEVPPEDESFTYRQAQAVGKAKIGSLRANDIPTVSLAGKEFAAVVKNVMMGYVYDVDELRKANKLGMSVDSMKGLACRRAIAETEEGVVFQGDTETGLVGIFGATGILNPARAGAHTWDDVAVVPADIIADVDALYNATWDATRGKDAGDTLVVGTIGWRQLNAVYQSPTFKDDTVMSFLLRTKPWLKSIEHAAWLDDIGASSKERTLLFKKDPSAIGVVTPLEFEQQAPQLSGWTFHVACRSKIGGVMVRKPRSVAYFDGAVAATGLTGGNVIG